MIECLTQHRLFVCAVKVWLWYGTFIVDWLCVLSKVYDDILSPKSFNHVCWPMDMMACHARRRPTLCDVQELWWHATPNFFQPCVLSKGCEGIPRPILSNCVWFPRAMCAYPSLTMFNLVCFKERWWHPTPDIVHICVHSKGDDGMPCPTMSNRAFGQRAIMSNHALFCPTICVL